LSAHAADTIANIATSPSADLNADFFDANFM